LGHLLTSKILWRPEDGNETLKEILNRASSKRDSAIGQIFGDCGAMPSWDINSGDERASMGWRMESGEDFMVSFRIWFARLSQDQQHRFQREFPEPESWNGFYNSIRQNSR
jgi:hypothetical protein